MRFEISSAVKTIGKNATYTTPYGATIKTRILEVGMTFKNFDFCDDIYNEGLKVSVYIEKTEDKNAPTMRDRIFKSTILRLSAMAEKNINPHWNTTREAFELFAYDAENGWVNPAEGCYKKIILEHIISKYGRNK